MKTVKINGVDVTPAKVTFELVCDMEDLGISLEDWSKKELGLLRAYLAASLGVGKKEAGKMIGEHVAKGGLLSELNEAMWHEVAESDFFAGLRMARETAEK
jgi:hypothetical protein